MGDGPDKLYHISWTGCAQGDRLGRSCRGSARGEVRYVGVFPNRPYHIAKLVERFGKGDRRLNFCYEADPGGYGLHRQLAEIGHDYIVVAPSLIPIKAGDRVKTIVATRSCWPNCSEPVS